MGLVHRAIFLVMVVITIVAAPLRAQESGEKPGETAQPAADPAADSNAGKEEVRRPVPEPLPRGAPDDLADRLRALRPSDPESYLKLGEDVAAWAEESKGRELARRLFGLAFVLDRQRSGGSTAPTATSACLALAQLASTSAERTWYLALARSLDRRLSLPNWASRRGEAMDPATAYLASLYVGLVRAGDTIRAQKVLLQPGVRELITRHERLLSPIGDTGGLNALEREMARWPCPECAGKRIVRKYQSIPPQYRVCSVCNGTLGPKIIPVELAAQLRFESRMLDGSARSWASEVLSDGGAPLMDVDPAEVPKILRMDPTQTLWREGLWLSPNPAPAPAAPRQAPKPGAPADDEASEPATDAGQ
jgi:hypothetical protein